MTVKERFLAKVVVVGSGCWIWQAASDKHGYGLFSLGGKTVAACKASYLLFKGEIPAGSILRHSCDNPPCVCPDHLLPGTYKDNIDDSRSRGRYINGERNGSAKLTVENVEEILLNPDTTCQVFADKFHVSASTIANVRRGDTWRIKELGCAK